MKKQVIRLTENDLHHIINETVQEVIAEDAGAFAQSLLNQTWNKFRNSNFYKNIADYKNSNWYQTALDASLVSDIPNMIKQLNNVKTRLSRLLPNNKVAASHIQTTINILNNIANGNQAVATQPTNVPQQTTNAQQTRTRKRRVQGGQPTNVPQQTTNAPQSRTRKQKVQVGQSTNTAQ